MKLQNLFENVMNTSSAINQLVFNVNTMHTLYTDTLPDRITRMYDADEHPDMFKTVKNLVARTKGKWFSDNYLSTSSRRDIPTTGMKNALVALSKDPRYFNIPELKQLSSFKILLDKTKQKQVDGSGADYTTNLEILPTVLIKMAKVSTEDAAEKLYNAAKRLEKAVHAFYNLWSRLQKQWENEHSEPEIVQPKQPKSTGQQQTQVEMLVNQVLGSLDKRVAAEIRPIIMRSDNKLTALQRELANRGITL